VTLSEHLQNVIDVIYSAQFVYGPLDSGWDAERSCLYARGDWKKGAREPHPDVLREWLGEGRTWSTFPVGGACSTVAGLVIALYADAGPFYREHWGRGITKALLEDPFLRTRTTPVWAPAWARPKNRAPYQYFPRRATWAGIAAGDPPLPEPLNAILYAGHVVCLVRTEGLELRHPRTEERLVEPFVIAADGSFRKVDLDGDGVKDERWYNGRPLRWESASERARRDPTSKVSVVGIRPPEALPASLSLRLA